MKIGTTTHPKFRSLMRSLALPQYAVVGLLESVWTLAAQFADDGDLSRFSAQEIADYAGYDGNADDLLAAMISSRWLDGEIGALCVHDWLDHCPHYVHDRRRKRRSSSDSTTSTDVPKVAVGVPGISRNLQEIPIKSDPTQPNPTMSNPDIASHGIENNAKPKDKPIGFDEWYKLYPRKVAPKAASKEFEKAIRAIQTSEKVESSEAIRLLMLWTNERISQILSFEASFQPYPSKWLKDERYRDELPKPRLGKENERFADRRPA